MGGIITVKRTKEENGWDILACDVGLADLTKTTIFFPEREEQELLVELGEMETCEFIV